MENAKILVVDDDPDLLHLIGLRLESAGYAVTLASSGFDALERFREARPQAVVTDLRMDGMDGHALFERLHAEAPTVPVIILTAHGTIPEAVAATQRGVFGFLTKPFDGHELLARVAAAVALSPTVADAGTEGNWRADIVSASIVMEELLRRAQRAAADSDALLIEGPRGSGKETLARAIHRAGKRAKKAFVAVRCGALSEKALQAELKAAAGGTIFLDDVGDLPFVAQAQLLPLVREHGFLLGVAPPPVDVRVIAATSQPLDKAIREGGFRADLFYALGKTTLRVPALSERREDIPLLVARFAAKYAEKSGTARSFSPEALALLQEASWLGNVRELAGVVEQALALSVAPLAPATLVRQVMREESQRELAAFDEARRAFEYNYLVQLLESTGGNVANAARIAQRNRTEFYKLLARHGLDPAAFKAAPK